MPDLWRVGGKKEAKNQTGHLKRGLFGVQRAVNQMVGEEGGLSAPVPRKKKKKKKKNSGKYRDAWLKYTVGI